MKYFLIIIAFLFSFMAYDASTEEIIQQDDDWEFANRWMLIKYAYEGDLDEVKKFIEEYKVDPDYKVEEDGSEYSGMTALTSAIEKEHYDIAKYLIAKGADINLYAYAVYSAYYPLDIAVMNDNYKFAKYLIDSGAYAGTEDSAGRNILFRVNRDTEEGFLFFKYLVEEHKQDIHAVDKYGWGLLRKTHGLKTLNYLLDNGIDVNSFTPVASPVLWDGYTALMVNASQTKYLAAIALLIKRGADVNYQSLIIGKKGLVEYKGGETALMIAAKSCSFENIDYLLLKGAKKGLKNYNGEIALNYAQKSRCSKNILGLLR